MCPACCSKARGYAWHETTHGTWKWQTATGKEGVKADLMHILCGECPGISEAIRLTERANIASNLRRANMLVIGRREKSVITQGQKELKEQLTHAQKAYTKGTARATEKEKEGMRKWIAGQLPNAGGTQPAHVKNIEKSITQAIRKTQAAAAQLRKAWMEAGQEENGRRATREGGREGAHWRGIGMTAWKASTHTAMIGADRTREAHGWTMATALIWYKTRANTNMHRTNTDTSNTNKTKDSSSADKNIKQGKGVVVFDIETTELIDDETPIPEMDLSIACAQWIPQETGTPKEALENADTLTIWNETVLRTPNGETATHIAHLLEWFDKAQVITGYGGRTFDMQVLRKYYKGDYKRWHSHMEKIHDPMDLIQKVTGRKHKLNTLLRINAIKMKTGEGYDAPRWWKQGKLLQLEAYCERDVAALAELITKDDIRLPGLQNTKTISINKFLAKQPTDNKEQNEEDDEMGETATTTEQNTTDVEMSATATEQNTTLNKRKRKTNTYDEIRRRKNKKRRTTVIYLDKRSGRGTNKRRAILMGTAAMEHVVRGQYEWRDGDLGPTKGKRSRYWQETLDNG